MKLEECGLYRLRKKSLLKGTGFSPYILATKNTGLLAPEGSFITGIY